MSRLVSSCWCVPYIYLAAWFYILTITYLTGFVLVIVSPVQSTYGGYYGLVVVTPRPPPRPQTFHRSHDNLKSLSDCFHILYVDWYRWEDSWEARWTRSNYIWATQGPPNSQKCTFLYIVAHIWKTGSYFFPLLYVCVLCYEVFFHILGLKFKHKNFLSDCFLIWHVHRYGWEDSWKAR